MIAVLQRVSEASVTVNEQRVGECGRGLAILLGVSVEDTERDAEVLAEKIAKLRVFEDDAGKMNFSVVDVKGQALVVSNFTLLANYRHGNRPEYLTAARPEQADPLYRHFCQCLEKRLGHVGRGIFGADMTVNIVGDGPVTIVMDSRELIKTKGN